MSTPTTTPPARDAGNWAKPVDKLKVTDTPSGAVNLNVEGKQVYYRANKKSPIFNELKSIVRKTFGIADVIRQSLEPSAEKIRVAFIFGSIA